MIIIYALSLTFGCLSSLYLMSYNKIQWMFQQLQQQQQQQQQQLLASTTDCEHDLGRNENGNRETNATTAATTIIIIMMMVSVMLIQVIMI